MKRIQLTWSRSMDDNTKSYRVFRSTEPKASRRDTLVMEVTHDIVPSPILISGDPLTFVEGGFYQSKYKNIMPDEANYPTQVFLNGVEISTLGIEYAVDFDNGIFIIDAEFNAGDVLVATYSIDAIRVFDTEEIEQENVTYFGPPARDRTEASLPDNISLLPDDVNGRITLMWSRSNTKGQSFYYRIEAIDDFGNFSMLSLEETIFLKEGLDNKGYLVERSYDDENWHTASLQAAETYIEYGIDREPPAPPKNANVDVSLNNSMSSADVLLNWEAAEKGSASASPYYRIRTISALGTLSQPSPSVGPVYVSSDISRYLIRRKIFDGAFPTVSGTDGVTVGQTDKDTLSFTDSQVDDNTTYGYSIYAVDVAGNYSIAATLVADVGDATPPMAVNANSITIASHPYTI